MADGRRPRRGAPGGELGRPRTSTRAARLGLAQGVTVLAVLFDRFAFAAAPALG